MRGKSNISMSDKAFISPPEFIEKIKGRFNLNRHQAEHLAFSSWRQFKLILAKDRETRERLRDILSEIDKGKHGK